MLINTTIFALVKGLPAITFEQQESLVEWLKACNSARRFQEVFDAQLRMIDSLVATERKSQGLNQLKKGLRALIPELKVQGDTQLIRKHQQEISSIEESMASLKHFRNCVLFLGDTLAARLVDPDAIRHFALYPSPGFISGKEGLASEIKAAKRLIAQGCMVLFNDITHCLRCGDLTVNRAGRVSTLEIKSNPKEYHSHHTHEQIAIPRAVHHYIEKDVIKAKVKPSDKQTEKFLAERRGHPSAEPVGTFVRLQGDFAEQYHDGVAGRLVKSLRKNKVAVVQEGLKKYVAARASNRAALSAAVSDLIRIGSWVGANIGSKITKHFDVPPFSLWLAPRTTVELLSGDLIVLTLFEMESVAELFRQKGIEIVWGKEQHDLFPVHFTSDYLKSEAEFEWKNVNVGDWQRLRVMFTNMSVESFVGICSFLLSPEAKAQMKHKTGRF